MGDRIEGKSSGDADNIAQGSNIRQTVYKDTNDWREHVRDELAALRRELFVLWLWVVGAVVALIVLGVMGAANLAFEIRRYDQVDARMLYDERLIEDLERIIRYVPPPPPRLGVPAPYNGDARP